MVDELNRIRARRKELGLTQTALAEQSGIRQSDISLLENSRRKPSLPRAQRLAQALSTTVEYLWPSQQEAA